MKKCPKCSRLYTDDSLNFCLEDGETLIAGDSLSETPTVIQLPELSTGTLSSDRKSTSPTAVLPTSELDRIVPKRSSTRYWLAAVSVVLLAFAGYFGYRYYFAHSNLPITSIAVLPFKNRGGEADTQYLSEGLAESLIYRLSQLPDLKVSPTSSVFRYEDKDVDPVAVGNELGVNAVVSGRIVPHGDSITISADLVDIRDNRLIWGEQYDRKMSELLDTQREIAREIVENLKIKVSSQEKGLSKHYTESNEAYQAYLKGRYYWNKRNTESMHRSIDYYQQAIDLDPGFALAYSGLADTYDLLSATEAGGGEESPNDVLPKAKAAALKSLAIDETLAEPHVSLAHVLYYYDRDWNGAEREFKRAIELNPRYSVAHHWYAVYLTVLGREAEALAEIKRAQELDPLSLPINVWVGRVLMSFGQYDQALDQLLKTKEMDPGFLLTRHWSALLLAERGNYDDAIAEANEASRLAGGRGLGLSTPAQVYAIAGRRREALALVDQMVDNYKRDYTSAGSIAVVYAELGDHDSAFMWLEKANDQHDMLTVRIKSDPRFAKLQGDPRLNDLVRRIGLPQS